MDKVDIRCPYCNELIGREIDGMLFEGKSGKTIHTAEISGACVKCFRTVTWKPSETIVSEAQLAPEESTTFTKATAVVENSPAVVVAPVPVPDKPKDDKVKGK